MEQPVNIISKAKKAASNEEYDKAIGLLAQIPESYTWSSSDLVFMSRVIQLSDEDKMYTLKDAEKALKQALDIAPDNIEVLLEIGLYESAVNDNANIALNYLNHAKRLCKQYLDELEKSIKDICGEQ